VDSPSNPQRGKPSFTLLCEKTILTAIEIRRSLVRIAHEILESAEENPILIGIKTRGVPLAHRITANITSRPHSRSC
jgi:pyrimidine operon attenuation protein/uracil phosphoribosyltransferase